MQFTKSSLLSTGDLEYWTSDVDPPEDPLTISSAADISLMT